MPAYCRLFFLYLLLALTACNSQKVDFTLLQLNDVYEIAPLNAGKTGGLARVATLQKQLKAANEHTYGILAGDLLSPSAIGTSLFNGERLAGKQMISVFNHLHWDYATFGNHEFDVGKAALLKRLGETKTVFFSSNVLDSATQHPFRHSRETVVFTVDGIKVGLAGITVPHKRLDFVTFLEPLAAANKAVQQLKQQQADVIILVTHQDLDSDIEFAEKLDGVDLIIGGHEHENVYVVRGAKLVPITKADANAKSAFIHNISIDKQSGAKHIESKLVFLDESVPLDAETTDLVNQWQQQAFAAFRKQGFEPDHVICRTQAALDGLESSVRNRKTALTGLIAKAFLQAYKNAELSLYNSGAIRIDDILPAGAITEYDVIKILPFGDNLSLVQLSGELLERTLNAGERNKGKGGFLQYANVSYVDKQWLVNGQAIDPKRSYKAAINNFLLEQGDEGLEFLTLNNNPSPMRLSAPPVDVRKALIQELISTGCTPGLP